MSSTSKASVCDRRAFLVLGAGAFAAAALRIPRGRRGALVRRSLPAMGTIADLAVVAAEPAAAHAALDAAAAELLFVERTMTRFDPLSEVGRANAGAFARPVAVGEETAYVIKRALDFAAASEGAFDPCLGRASELWDVTHRTEPPPAAEVARLAHRRLFRSLDLDRWRGTPVVRFRESEIGLDLGGIAKGYAVDRAVAVLRERGVRGALVNVGGDLYALGRSNDGEPWRIGIRSPEDPSALVDAFDAEDLAVATSGDYERYFRYRGRTYHHLLDPETAAPRIAAMHTVTVEADTCLAADAAATTLFGAAPAAAARFLRARAERIQVRNTC